jgi:DNA-3-methyladenine glycosylase I
MDADGELTDLVVGPDGLARCWWAGTGALMASYHDHEWGRGPRDERSLYERLSLEAFQAGLSWRVVLERREQLRKAFAGFDPIAVATFTDEDVRRVLATPGTIRNLAKVRAIVSNAQLLLRLHAEGSGLGALTEEVLAAEVLAAAELRSAAVPTSRSDVPAHTPTSVALARRLRAIGWRFVGPTTAYAYLQAVGWVDDHLAGCHVRETPGSTTPLR